MVAQPQTVASLVDMQGDEAVHRMPVMMIVHEMRKYALVLITFHCKLKEKTCLNLSRNWLLQFDEIKKCRNLLQNWEIVLLLSCLNSSFNNARLF